jgi:hypothetical protein
VKLTIMQGRRKQKGKGQLFPQILPEIEKQNLIHLMVIFIISPP